jgi:exonuclease SbcC
LRLLNLHNYRRYADQVVEFPDGLIGIVGENGAGKTTIIEAVAWALYGQDAARTSKEFVKREGSPPDEICRVELEFELGGTTYKIVRDLRGTSLQTSAVLYKGGNPRPEAVTARQVTDRVRRILGLDMKSFFTSVFARQKELNSLSDATPGERRTRVLRMLRISLIDVALKALRSDKRIEEETVARLKQSLLDEDALQSELASLRNDVSVEQSEISTLQVDHTNAERLLRKSTSEKNRWDRGERNYREIESLVSSHKTGVDAAKQNLAELDPEIVELRQEQAELPKLLRLDQTYRRASVQESQLRKLQMKYAERENLIERCRDAATEQQNAATDVKLRLHSIGQLSGVQGRLRSIATQEASYSRATTKIQRAISKLETEIAAHIKHRSEVETQLKSVRNLGPDSPCPICRRKFGSLHGEIAEHWKSEINRIILELGTRKSALSDARGKESAISLELNRLGDERAGLEDKDRQRTRDVDQVSFLKQRSSELGRKLKELRRQLKAIGQISYNPTKHALIQKQLETLTEAHDTFLQTQRDVRRLPELVARRRTLAVRLTQFSQKYETDGRRLAAVGYNPTQHAAAKRAQEGARKAVEDARNEITRAKGELKLARHKLNEKRAQILQEAEKRKAVARDERKVADLRQLEETFQAFRSELVSRIRPMLAARTGELLRTLSQGRYPEVELDEDYELQIRDEGKLFPLPRFSGGEEDLANLCLRIAISQVIAERGGAAPMNFIVLDEIFGSQDANRRSSILRSLKDLSAQFQQVFLITHVEDVKDVLPYALVVRMRGDGTSDITVEGGPGIVES